MGIGNKDVEHPDQIPSLITLELANKGNVLLENIYRPFWDVFFTSSYFTITCIALFDALNQVKQGDVLQPPMCLPRQINGLPQGDRKDEIIGRDW